jgi:predicted RNA binding protein with dsRBD fold (UPF0201 family)
MKITIPVNPTEDIDKLTESVNVIADHFDVKVEPDVIVATTEDISKLLEKIRDKKIARTATDFLERRGFLVLNKQALIVGKLNIVYVEQPLGSVKIEVDIHKFKSLLSAEAASLP